MHRLGSGRTRCLSLSGRAVTSQRLGGNHHQRAGWGDLMDFLWDPTTGRRRRCARTTVSQERSVFGSSRSRHMKRRRRSRRVGPTGGVLLGGERCNDSSTLVQEHGSNVNRHRQGIRPPNDASMCVPLQQPCVSPVSRVWSGSQVSAACGGRNRCNPLVDTRGSGFLRSSPRGLCGAEDGLRGAVPAHAADSAPVRPPRLEPTAIHGR